MKDIGILMTDKNLLKKTLMLRLRWPVSLTLWPEKAIFASPMAIGK